MPDRWGWTDKPRQELPNRSTLLKAYNIEAEGLQKIHVRAAKQLVCLKLEEQMLLRMLATARAALPADSPLLQVESEALRASLEGVQQLNTQDISHRAEETPAETQHEAEPAVRGEGNASEGEQTAASPETAEQLQDEGPGASRLNVTENLAAFQQLLDEADRHLFDTSPDDSAPKKARKRPAEDSDSEWEDAAVGGVLGGSSYGDLIFGSALKDVAEEIEEEASEEGEGGLDQPSKKQQPQSRQLERTEVGKKSARRSVLDALKTAGRLKDSGAPSCSKNARHNTSDTESGEALGKRKAQETKCDSMSVMQEPATSARRIFDLQRRQKAAAEQNNAVEPAEDVNGSDSSEGNDDDDNFEIAVPWQQASQRN